MKARSEALGPAGLSLLGADREGTLAMGHPSGRVLGAWGAAPLARVLQHQVCIG